MTFFILLAIGCLVLIVGVTIYNYLINGAIHRYVSKADRNQKTGIMKGAEPIYLENKTKKAALLIHGFIGSPTDYGQLPNLLFKNGYTVKVPLLPGHGTDPRDFSKITAKDLEEFVLREYRALKTRYEEVTLIGFSMGGALSIITATTERIDRLILLAPYLQIKHRWFYILPTEWYNKIFMHIIPYVYRPLAFKQIMRKAVITHLVDYDFVSLKGANTAILIGNRAIKEASRLKQPTLVIHGKPDMATDYKLSQELAQNLGANCRFVTVHKSNHIVLWDYDRESVEDEVLQFISDENTISQKSTY